MTGMSGLAQSALQYSTLHSCFMFIISLSYPDSYKMLQDVYKEETMNTTQPSLLVTEILDKMEDIADGTSSLLAS